jgi:hypothetical protein
MSTPGALGQIAFLSYSSLLVLLAVLSLQHVRAAEYTRDWQAADSSDSSTFLFSGVMNARLDGTLEETDAECDAMIQRDESV